jgi:hypothetical protein
LNPTLLRQKWRDQAAQVRRHLRFLEEEIKARLEADISGLASGVRGRLESSLPLSPVTVAPELLAKEGPFGFGEIRTEAWEAPGVRKLVLSTVRARPIVEGFAIVILPDKKLRAPVFAGDFMALPTRISVHADVYGTRELGSLPLDTLAPLKEHFARLGTSSGPPFAAGLSSGLGLHAKLSPRLVDEAFAALTAALGRALEVMKGAGPGDGGARTQEIFFQTFHTHGPRRGVLGRLMGREWADRYSRLIFE